MGKRLLACLLSLILCCNVFLQPVSASYDDGTEVEYLVDDRGYIIIPSNYSLGGLAIAGATGAGFLGGSATLLGPGALGILAILIGSGLSFSSVGGYAAEANRLYSSLSEDIQLWFNNTVETAIENGSNAIELTADAYSQLNQAYNDSFLTDGGLRTTGSVDLDLTGFLAFNSNDKIDSDTLDTDIDFHSLNSYSYTTIPDSDLSVRLVTDLASYGYTGTDTYGLEVLNTVTGISMFLVDSFLDDSWYKDCCNELMISAPTAYTKSYSTCENTSIGFWILRDCSDTSHSLRQYLSLAYPNNENGQVVSSYASFMVMGNVLADSINGVWFDGWTFTPASNSLVWKLLDGTTMAMTQTPAIMTVNEPDYTITKDDAYDLPGAGTTLTLPSDEALNNVNTITAAQVLADTATPENPGTGTDTDGTVLGFLDAIFKALAATGPLGLLLSAIGNGITDIYLQIGNLSTAWDTYWDNLFTQVQALPQAIGQVITGVLEAVFVPDLTAISPTIEIYNAKFQWATDIYNFILRILEALNPSEPPKISINLAAAESPGGYNWGTSAYVLDMSWYARYKSSVDTILSGIIWVYFLWALFKRIPDIMSGVGMIEENRTLPQGNIFMERDYRDMVRERSETRWEESRERQADYQARKNRGKR